MGDPLFSVKNSFYLGAYNNAINDAADLDGQLSEIESVERDVLVYRSYIALGSYEVVLSEIRDSAATSLLAVRLFAQYKAGSKPKGEVLSTLGEWLGDTACNRNATVLLMAGLIFANEGMYEDALKTCQSQTNLELMAHCVHVLLLMHRTDKAEQQLKAMAAVDDDATVTQLATAWVGLALGGTKLREAQYIYQELGDKFTFTASVYNGRAACFMKQGDFEDAERDLLEAFGKEPKNADTLASLITCGLHLGKSTARYVTQLKLAAPGHPAAARLAAADEQFSFAAASMA